MGRQEVGKGWAGVGWWVGRRWAGRWAGRWACGGLAGGYFCCVLECEVKLGTGIRERIKTLKSKPLGQASTRTMNWSPELSGRG